MVRQPAVAGQFYPSHPDRLRAEVTKHLGTPAGTPAKAIGIVSPHAGYVYSGGVAGALLSAIEIPDTVLILGPNHHGIGAPVAVYPEGEWLTPLGSVPIAADLVRRLKASIPQAELDTRAHQLEHSLEVQVPFLQVLRPDVQIAAICLGFGDFRTAGMVGEGVAAALRDYGKDVLIVASSDMSHFETDEAARALDELAIRKVLDLDPAGLHDICRQRRITMCGVIPTTSMLVAAKMLGGAAAELIGYATSGDISGDRNRVVGYAGIVVFPQEAKISS